MYAHLEIEPDLSNLPPAEGVVLARALSKEPGKRWPNCRVFVNELIHAQQQAEEKKRKEHALSSYNCGVAWLDKVVYDKAILDFDEAIRIDPNNAFAYLRRGDA